jgi:hypothetical protein
MPIGNPNPIPTETPAWLLGTAAKVKAAAATATNRNFFQLMMIPPLKIPRNLPQIGTRVCQNYSAKAWA